MKVSFLNGQIVADGYLHEDVSYDVSANNLSVCFDGKGGISKYLSVRSGRDYSVRSMTSFYKDGERVGAYTAKRVSMVGRGQKIDIFGDGYRIEMKQFITKEDDAVFVEVSFFAERKTDFTLVYGTGYSWETPALACDGENAFVEENSHFLIPVSAESEKRIRFVFAYEEDKGYCERLLSAFDEKLQAMQKEVDDVIIPASAQTEEEKALYLSALFCAIENYKECGELKGFVAGCNYLNPLRTYYRDSYWTVLPAYRYNISLVKQQVCMISGQYATNTASNVPRCSRTSKKRLSASTFVKPKKFWNTDR